MNIRNVLIGLILAALAAGVIVSCGGGGGGGGGTPPAPTATFNVSGNVTGSTAASVVKLNGGSDFALTSAGGAFSFTGVTDGTTFNVQIVNGTDRCSVSNGAGTLAGADVTGVSITCIAQGTELVVRSTRLTGAQETPAVVSSGNGGGGIIFDPGVSKAITGGVTVFGITPTSVSLMQGASGTAGTEVVQLGTAGDGHTFFIPTGFTLSPGQITALFAGQLYFDVFTAAHLPPGMGEIRGQLDLQGGVIAGQSTLNFAQEQAGGTDATCTSSTATGQGTVIVDRATRLILSSYMIHNVGANTSLAHIHTSVNPAVVGCAGGGPACSSGVIINFVKGPALNYPADASAPLSATPNISDFLADTLYFNIHSLPNCGSGEIRGNIAHILGI